MRDRLAEPFIKTSSFDGRDLSKVILLDAAEFEGAGLERLAASIAYVASQLVTLWTDMASQHPGSTRAPDRDRVYDLLREQRGTVEGPSQ